MVQRVPRTILIGWDILVVDDDTGSLRVAEFILKRYGANVLTAVNGSEGVSVARKCLPKFVVSDISMPVLDGWGLLRELKLEQTTHAIPIIALSAHAMQRDRQKALEAGFHNYLTKPINPMTFVDDLLGLVADIPEVRVRLDSQGIRL